MEPVMVTTSPYPDVLTAEAVDFVAALDRAFAARRVTLLERRRRHRAARTGGPGFPAATTWIRDDPSWTVPAAPDDLADRRVEIVSPPEPDAAAAALASGAGVWVADLADGMSPTWENVIRAQRVLRTAAGAPGPAIEVRPRGWHLPERHLRIGGRPVPAALVDAGLYLFHSARRIVEAGSGPYFSLPGLESYHEARLWADVFAFAEDRLGLPRGTVRATFEIGTVGAAFEAEEILYAARPYATGLAATRQQYLTSLIGHRPGTVLPPAADLGAGAPVLRAYAELVVRAAHRRGAHAIGATTAVLPSRDPVAARRDLNAVRQDRRREVGDGFDGCRVGHPALVGTAREVFDQWLGDRPHQLTDRTDGPGVTADDLLGVPGRPVTVGEVALRTTVSTALRYLASWLDGHGTTVLDGRPATAADAELAAAQLWQWIAAGTPTCDGVPVTAALAGRILSEEVRVLAETGALDDDAARRYGSARRLLAELVTERTGPPSTLLTAYLRLLAVPRVVSSRADLGLLAPHKGRVCP